MKTFLKLVLLFASLQILLAVNQNNENEVLIVVSYDAFRNEYFNRNVTNFMNTLRTNGTSSDYIVNVFPTKTFPNHHTIATGVFPDKHGVLANALYDFDLKASLNYSFELYHFKSEIKPIWILNEMNGGRSGCMMWPGSNYTYDGYRCSFSRHYNTSENYETRVDEVFNWLKSENPPNLIMFYIEEPDTHAHAFGPNSQKITELVATLNNVTEYLYRKIHEFHMENRVSVIHLSDHGMDELELQNVIDLRKIIDPKKVKFYGSTPVLQIVPNVEIETDDLYEKLRAEAEKGVAFKVYLNSNLPERWKFANDIRVGPITVVANPGFGFQDMFDSADYYEQEYKIPKTPTTKYGVHGYDNIFELMHPIFFAYGSRIKSNNVVKPFNTVDLIHLFCEILGIEPPEYVEGERENILGVLKSQNAFGNVSRWMVIILSVVVSTVLVTALMFALKLFKRNRSIPTYLYDEDTTILDDAKFSINSSNQSSYPSTSSFQVA